MWANKQKGFTIVELLIVIVVIAILAAITIVAYNGIQNRAKDSAVKSALSNAAKKVATVAATNNDLYPATESAFLAATNLTENATVAYDYYASTSGKEYCVSVTNTQSSPQISYAATQESSGPLPGKCVINDVRTPYPVGGAGAWTGYNSAGGNTPSYTPAALDGRDAYRYTLSSAGFATNSTIGLEYTGTTIPVVGGVEISPAIYIRASKAGNYRIHQNARTSTTDLGSTTGPTTAIPMQTWVKLSNGKYTPPALADRLSIRAQYVGGTTWASGDWIEITQVSTIAGDVSYGDGLTEYWSWVGTPNNSASFGPAQ